jgi:hypothetical protein
VPIGAQMACKAIVVGSTPTRASCVVIEERGTSMPRIIVQADRVDGGPGAVTLTERSIPVQEHNDHYLAQLVERVCWALIDAEQLEQFERPAGAADTVRCVEASPVSSSAARR